MLCPFPFEIDCDNTANNIPNPAAVEDGVRWWY